MHGWGKGTTQQRRPDYGPDTARRKREVALWRRANCERTVDDTGKVIWYGRCPECGHVSTKWVADHIVPIAEGGDEGAELRVHCIKCSNAQGSALAHKKRRG